MQETAGRWVLEGSRGRGFLSPVQPVRSLQVTTPSTISKPWNKLKINNSSYICQRSKVTRYIAVPKMGETGGLDTRTHSTEQKPRAGTMVRAGNPAGLELRLEAH